MKVIFLDVDGVLNSEKFYRKRGAPDYRFEDEPEYPLCEFDPEAVELLNKIIEETGAKIVVSSTWRIGRTVGELIRLFREVGIEGYVIDRTGVLRDRKEYEKVVRGTEIKTWLDQFPEVESYIIIDDDNDMLPEQQKNFIKTSFWVGLTPELVEKSIKILNK